MFETVAITIWKNLRSKNENLCNMFGIHLVYWQWQPRTQTISHHGHLKEQLDFLYIILPIHTIHSLHTSEIKSKVILNNTTTTTSILVCFPDDHYFGLGGVYF